MITGDGVWATSTFKLRTLYYYQFRASKSAALISVIKPSAALV